jgi:hypothetical protein
MLHPPDFHRFVGLYVRAEGDVGGESLLAHRVTVVLNARAVEEKSGSLDVQHMNAECRMQN